MMLILSPIPVCDYGPIFLNDFGRSVLPHGDVRMTRTQQIDGGSYIEKRASNHADRTFALNGKITEAQHKTLNYFWENLINLSLSTPEANFTGVIKSMNIFGGNDVTITFWVISRQPYVDGAAPGEVQVCTSCESPAEPEGLTGNIEAEEFCYKEFVGWPDRSDGGYYYHWVRVFLDDGEGTGAFNLTSSEKDTMMWMYTDACSYIKYDDDGGVGTLSCFSAPSTGYFKIMISFYAQDDVADVSWEITSSCGT